MPVAKSIHSETFCLVGILRCTTTGIGSKRVARSIRILRILRAQYAFQGSIHVDSSMFISQAAATGRQGKTLSNMYTSEKELTIPIRP